MKVAIAGASGLVGRHLIELLVGEGKIESVVSFVRSKSAVRHSKVQERIVDFHSILEPNLSGCEVGLCCLGTTMKKAGSKDLFYKVDHDYVLNFAKFCRSSGAKTFIVVSAMGANPSSSVYYNQVKGRTEKDLEGIGFESLIILRPSLLLGKRLEARTGEDLAQRILTPLSFLFKGPFAAYKPIQGLAVAIRMKDECLKAENPAVSGHQILLNHQIEEN